MEEKKVEAVVRISDLMAADVVVVRGLFLPAPFNWLSRFLTTDTDGISIHTSFFDYGKNDWGTDLVCECIGRSGPSISPFSGYVEKKQIVEVYRIEHPYADVYRLAILLACDKTLYKFGHFDWLLIFPRNILIQIGFTGRINHKYYPFWWCAEYLQTRFEEAVNYIKDAIEKLNAPYIADEVIEAYKKDVLARFPKARLFKNKTRAMRPHDWRHPPFLKKVGEGRLVY